ncbi:carboxypeptidase regulatory-like domain-containing protein [Neolewinella persica]|uniref:carboxypeptidase regulatory-like domain-containing protein n=1 Tax=Neolewinella persica TaxID=70998 RepID=UPI0004776AAF|nr:carboxypeptidase regulatory-like domain-containing protein [Neolewinella persica]
MKIYSLIFSSVLLVLSCSGWLSSQQEVLKGTVVDAVSGDPIAYANVTAGLASSTPFRIENFAVSDLEGAFQLKLRGDSLYVLQTSYLGYQTTVDTLKMADLPDDFIVAMRPATNDLSTIEVTYKLPVRVSGDTISYAADAFSDGNERKLEDILKRLPGFAVDDNGQISVNGKKVDDLKVDGKDFFGGNSKLAARSLPANAVDRIDVLNNYSADEQMGQFSDGRGTALNIRLRKDKKNLVFGEVYAGYGPGAVKDFGTDAFYFGPTASVNLITNHNDVGRQILTFRDMFRLNGGFAADRGASAISFTPTQLGLSSDPELNAERSAGLAALSTQYQPNQQFNASGTLLYGNNHHRTISQTLRTVLGQDAQSDVEQVKNGVENNRSLTGLLRLDFKASKALSLSYRALAGKGSVDTDADTRIVSAGQSLPPLGQQNDQRNDNVRQQLRINYSKTDQELWILRLDHQAQRVAGTYRLESMELPFNFTDTSVNGQNYLQQQQDNQVSAYGTRGDYYRSLNNANQINLYIGMGREVSVFNAELTTTEETVVGTGIAPGDRFQVSTFYAGVGHRSQIKKWRFSPGLRLEQSLWQERISENTTTGSKPFLLPQAEIRYDIRKSSSISLNYDQSVSWPGADQRTSALILRNLFSLTNGTGQLRETRHHDLSLSYYNYNLFNQTTYSADVTLSRMERPLTQQITLSGTGQLITAINADRPGDLISGYFQLDKYLEYFKFSGSVQSSLAISQIRLENIRQINHSASSALRLNMRTRFKKWPNLATGAHLAYNNYRAGTQDARKYLSLEPTVQVYGNLLPRLSFSSKYRYRSYRQLDSNNRTILGRLEADLRYETKGQRFSGTLTAYNILNQQNFQQEQFSDFLLNVSNETILGRRLIFKLIYQL